MSWEKIHNKYKAGKQNSRPPRGKFQGGTRMFDDDDRSRRNLREIARTMDKNTQDPSAAAGSDKPPRGSFTSFMKASHFSFMQHHRRFWVLLLSVAGTSNSIVTIHHSTLSVAPCFIAKTNCPLTSFQTSKTHPLFLFLSLLPLLLSLLFDIYTYGIVA